MAAHVGRVDHDLLALLVGGVEADLVEHALHHRLQAPRADVLDRSFTSAAISAIASMASAVNSRSTPSVASSALYCLIRLASGSVRMRRKSSRVSAPELDADRQAALQLGQQVRRLGDVEGARGDEQDVVGLHRPVLGGDRGALDQRQQVALHALAAHVGADRALASARRSCRSRRGRRCRCSRRCAIASCTVTSSWSSSLSALPRISIS